MALICAFSTKGSPGVTTAAMALAATWPDPRTVVLAELDASGGDLAARFPVDGGGPSTVSLAEALRRCEPWTPPSQDLLMEHSRLLLGSVRALVSPIDPREVRAPLEVIGERAEWLAAGPWDVLADCGRLPLPACFGDPLSPFARLLTASSLVLAVSRPERPSLLHLALLLPAVRELARGAEVQVLLSGRADGTRADEIEEALGVRIAGTLPHDPTGADVLAGRIDIGGHFRRGRVQVLPLLRHARSLAGMLAATLEPPGLGSATRAAVAEEVTL